MYVPTIPHEKAVDEDGTFTKPWDNYLEQQAQNLQLCLGDEGFVIPSVSSDPNSVTPPAAGGQLAQVQATFGQQTGAQASRFVFDPYEVNGATPPARNGQLKILLNDGIFHPVTNT